MLHASALWMTALAMIALAVTASPALSADLAAKKRCTDLVAFYDRWGTTRTEHNEGARNTRRIAAAIDCERGDHAAGIAELEALLVDKSFEVPVDVGQAPMYFPDENLAQALKPR